MQAGTRSRCTDMINLRAPCAARSAHKDRCRIPWHDVYMLLVLFRVDLDVKQVHETSNKTPENTPNRHIDN